MLMSELARVSLLTCQIIRYIIKNISMDDPYTLQILAPWFLMYGEYEEHFIEVLRQRIGPKHPLYNREVYAIAIRRDPEAILFHAHNDGFCAIVYFSGVPRGRPRMPKTEIFSDDRAVGEKIAADHAERLEQYKRGREN
jgi:hypothetical protein